MKGATARLTRNRLPLLALAAVLLVGSCLADFGGLPPNEPGSPAPPGAPPPPPPPGPPPPPPGSRLTSIVVTREGPDTLIALGRSVRLSAEARDQHGKVMRDIDLTWSVDSGSVVELDRDDDEVEAEAAGNGTAVVTASAQGVRGSATLVVWQRVGDVEVTPNNRDLDLFESVELTAVAYDVDEHRVTRPLEWEWSADRDFAVAITPHADDRSKARVTRVFGGRTIITVRAEGESDTATIR